MACRLLLVMFILYTPMAYAETSPMEDTTDLLYVQAEVMTENAEELADEPETENDALDMDFRLDLRIEVLDLGMEAPFSGILFTTDSLTKMQLTHKQELALLQSERDYMEQKFNLRLNSLLASWQNEKTLYAAELSAKRNYIEQLEEKTLSTSDWTPLYIVSSFVVGAITTIAITYALKPATE